MELFRPANQKKNSKSDFLNCKTYEYWNEVALIDSRRVDKLGRVFPMVVVSILPHAEFGPNDHREDAPHFIAQCWIRSKWASGRGTLYYNKQNNVSTW